MTQPTESEHLGDSSPTSSVLSFDSAVPAVQPDSQQPPAGIPVDSQANSVAAETILLITRSSERCFSPRTWAISLDDGSDPNCPKRQLYHVVCPRQFIASKSNEELKPYRMSPSDQHGGAEEKGDLVGTANFHHWIVDQSRSLIIKLAEDSHGEGGHSQELGQDGEQAEQGDLRRTGWCCRHKITMQGKKLYWKGTRDPFAVAGEEAAGKTSLWGRFMHLKCVDDNDEVLAVFASSKGIRHAGKRRGVFKVSKEGMSKTFVENLLVSCLAMMLKQEKRLAQASLTGIAGGVPTAALRVVQG